MVCIQIRVQEVAQSEPFHPKNLKRKTPGRSRGSSLPTMAASLLDLDAPAVGVRPLILVGVAVGADERRGRPGALVVGLFAGAAVPPAVHGVGRGLTGLVAGEVLLVLHVR